MREHGRLRAGDGREPGKEWVEYGNHAGAGGRRRIRSIKFLMTF